MTSSSALREGDRVAVSRNCDWRFFKLGVVLRVLGAGARVRLDDARTATERKGIEVHSSCVRFAYRGDGQWVAERERRHEPSETIRERAREVEEMPEKPDSPAVTPASAAATLLEKIRSAGVTWEEIEAAVGEAKAAESVRRRKAEIEDAEAQVEDAVARVALAEEARDRAEKEMTAAKEMYDASVAAFEATVTRLADSKGLAAEAQRKLAALTREGA